MANLGCSKDSNTDSAWSPCKKPSSRKPAGFFKLRIVFRSGTALGEVGLAAAHSEPHIRHIFSLDACSFSDAHGFNGCRSSRPRVVSVLAVASGRDASPSRLANTCSRGGRLVLSRIVGRARDITQRLRTDRTNGCAQGLSLLARTDGHDGTRCQPGTFREHLRPRQDLRSIPRRRLLALYYAYSAHGTRYRFCL